MIKKAILFLVIFFSSLSHSQEIKSYTWDEKPVFAAIPEEYKDQPAVVLFDKRWIHTRVGAYAFATFGMNHFAIKINKSEEINKYNKIKAQDNGYIRDVRDFHARIIKPDGKINVLPQEKIIEVEIEKIKSIIFEGVEAGDILEYYFVIKENPQSYGVEIFQKEIPVLLAEFSHTQSGVKFETFASPEFKSTMIGGKTVLTAKNIAAYKEEYSAKNTKNLTKLIYMVSETGFSTFSWSYYLPTYFKKPSFAFLKKNQAREFIENLTSGTAAAKSTDEKLIAIDNYIKDNFEFVQRGEAIKKVTDLNNGKQKLTPGDMFDLYGFAFKELKIPYEIVVGMSRFLGDIDSEKFVVPLDHDFMYYISETEKFVSPYEQYLCYGYPMFELQGTEGKTYEPLSGSKTVAVRKFPIADANYTIDLSESTVTLSEDLTVATIEKSNSYSGYDGQLNRNWVKYIKENEEPKELEEYIKNRLFESKSNLKLLNFTFENPEFKHNYKNTPFIAKAKAQIEESFTENAGNLIIVNLGKSIGKQSDLYQETKRKFDVDIRYAKTYKHKIIFNIPVGYEVESFKDLLIDKKMSGDETKNCSFKSTAKIEGNQLIVEVFEVYKSINYPKEMYQEYRNVYNAASDFSKASIVLKEKK